MDLNRKNDLLNKAELEYFKRIEEIFSYAERHSNFDYLSNDLSYSIDNLHKLTGVRRALNEESR